MIQVDDKQIAKDTKDLIGKFAAIRSTLKNLGYGCVIVTRRDKESWEKKRPLHGRAIANILADKGHNPFASPQSVRDIAHRFVVNNLTTAVTIAFKRRKNQKEIVKDIFRRAAEKIAEWAKRNIESGGLGENSKGVKRYKEFSLGRRGRITTKYGSCPPYGVRTGRFLDCIEVRHRTGKPSTSGRSEEV
jgi:hypothetical protein